ncbi:hydrolase [Bacteroidales bacterium]|nr:hydrolase [Bacteroidales bacterium]
MRKSIIYLFIMIPLLATSQKNILINNVEIFNGVDEKTITGNVLIVDNLIAKISTSPIATNKSAMVTIIDGGGKFLMPGMIDAHAHTTMDAMPLAQAMVSDMSYISLFSANSAEKQLLRGFTSVRDVGGNPFALKKAIDQGLTNGPRIYPSGAMISQTGGHGDFRLPTDVPRHSCGALTYMESCGMAIIADGYDEVLLKSREQLRQGATQIKLAAGGGVASDYDPLDVAQYTKNEFTAAVDATDNWGTYVTVHAYTPKAIKAAISAGVKCIEHGQLIDEETTKLMAEKDIWWCLQAFLDDEDAIPFPEGSSYKAKQLEMTAGTDNAYKLAKKYKIKTAWGSDCLFDEKLTTRQGAQLAKLTRWYTPFEVLRMATSTNAELLALCGPRNPYPHKLGVIKEGAYADLILVDGSPIKNIKLIENPEQNFLLIVKDGIIYKNTIL